MSGRPLSAVRQRPMMLALRSRWALLSLATLLYWVANQAIRPFRALRLQQLGATDLTIGLALAAASVAALVLAVPSGRLLDRLPQREALVLALLGLAASTAAFPLAGSVLLLPWSCSSRASAPCGCGWSSSR